MTRTRVVVLLIVAAVAAAAIAGPGHPAALALIAGAAFLGLVAVGVVHGVRDGIAREREETGAEPPPAGGDGTVQPPP